MWIELKVNNKYTTPMPVMLFWLFYCYLSSIVFIVYFEQVVARWTGDAIVSDKFILNIYGENIALLSWEKLSDCKFVSLFIQNTGQRGPIPTFLTSPLLKFWLYSLYTATVKLIKEAAPTLWTWFWSPHPTTLDIRLKKDKSVTQIFHDSTSKR